MAISSNQAVRNFRKKYNLFKPTLEDMKRIITSQGYTIVEFNAIFNDTDVAAIIENLKLDDLISQSKGFTYADAKYRLVFVHEDLSDDEKLSVLTHEEGHIFCGHIEENSYFGRDVQQEVEANEFSFRLLNPGGSDKFANFLNKNKVWLIAVTIAVIIGIVGVVYLTSRPEPREEFYVTQTGSKYHRKDCIYVKNKTNIRPITDEQLAAGEYSPCSVCMPQK